jgi:hypothetical protein
VSSTSSSGSSSAARQRSPGSPGDPADRGVAENQVSGAAAAAVLPAVSDVLPAVNDVLPAVSAQAPVALPAAPAPAAPLAFDEPRRVGTGAIWAFVELFKHSTDSDTPAERIGAALRLWKIILGTLVGLAVCAVVAMSVLVHSVHGPHGPHGGVVRWVVGWCTVGGVGSIFGVIRLRRSLAGRRRVAAQAQVQDQQPDPRRGGADADADSP